MENKVVRLEEYSKQCSVTVISSTCNLIAKDFTWKKDGEGIDHLLEQGVSVDAFTITFNEITRDDVGNYSVKSLIPCHEGSNPRSFSGKIILDVICKYNIILHVTKCLSSCLGLFTQMVLT